LRFGFGTAFRGDVVVLHGRSKDYEAIIKKTKPAWTLKAFKGGELR